MKLLAIPAMLDYVVINTYGALHLKNGSLLSFTRKMSRVRVLHRPLFDSCQLATTYSLLIHSGYGNSRSCKSRTVLLSHPYPYATYWLFF